MLGLIILISFAFVLAAAMTGYGLWRHGILQNWILSKAESAVVRIYHEKIEGHLPFEVEKIEYQRNWNELVIGRVNNVSITLRKDDLRIHLEGPLSFPAIRWATFEQLYRKARGLPIEPADKNIELDYSPSVTFEALKSSNKASLPDGFSAQLHVRLSGEINELQEARIALSTLPQETSWHWKALGLELQNPILTLQWKDDKNPENSPLTAELMAKSFAYKENVSLAQPHLTLQIPLKLKPFELGSLLRAKWEAESGEALFGERYFSLPENPLHGNAEILLDSSKKTPKWAGLNLTLGKSRGPQLHLQLKPDTNGLAKAKLDLDPVSFKDVVPVFLKSTANAGAPFSGLGFLQEVDFKEGKLSLSAQGQLPLDFSRLSAEGRIEKAKLEIENADFLWPAHQLAVKGLRLSVPYTARQGVEGELSITRFGFRKLRGNLRPTRISFDERDKHSTFRIGEKGSRIPLDLDGLFLGIDSIGGTAQLSPLQYDLVTRASLEPIAAERLMEPLCLIKPGKRIPPAKIQLNLPKVEISAAGTDLTGFARADLFGGKIQIDEMGMFNLFSPVPEFDFNLTVSGIDLHSLGEWVNFGEMDGTLEAYAHDVVFQSWLPTQYDFEIKVNPNHHSDVVFSPTAMKNFARLFTQDGIDHMPGYVQWLAFGWPSSLLGGYDIKYAGVRIRSEDGYIHLETLDPVTDADPYNSHQKHFILYGRRFKIPLNSSRYPLILDAPAMGNYVHQMFDTIQGLAKKKEETRHENENLEEDKLPAECTPSDLSRI